MGEGSYFAWDRRDLFRIRAPKPAYGGVRASDTMQFEGDCAYMIHPEQLGSRIAERRRARGLTQGQIADRMGVSPQAVSKWERGLACPDLVFLDDLADLLDISLQELLTGRSLVALSA